MTNLDDIFANITPADFALEDAGVLKHVDPSLSLFDRFVQSSLHGVSMSFAAAGGELTYPILVLADGARVDHLPNPGGTLGEVLDYVKEEAATRNSTMFFYAIQTLVGSSNTLDEVHGQEASNVGIYFYAGHRFGERCQGAAKKVGDTLGPIMVAPQEQPAELFDAVFEF